MTGASIQYRDSTLTLNTAEMLDYVFSKFPVTSDARNTTKDITIIIHDWVSHLLTMSGTLQGHWIHCCLREMPHHCTYNIPWASREKNPTISLYQTGLHNHVHTGKQALSDSDSRRRTVTVCGPALYTTITCPPRRLGLRNNGCYFWK